MLEGKQSIIISSGTQKNAEIVRNENNKKTKKFINNARLYPLPYF